MLTRSRALLVAALAASSILAATRAQAQTLPNDPPPPDCTLPASGPLQANCVYLVNLQHMGYARSYKLLVPAGFTLGTRASVVVDYHGYGSTKSDQVNASCWKDKAKEEKFVVAYPHGTGTPVSFSAGDYCCSSPIQPARDDVQFAKDVVADVKQRIGTPATAWKAFASGLSNGGAVAHNLGCDANDVFSGIAAVSQTFPKNTSVCLARGERHVPVVDFRATNDTLIPYNGGWSWDTLGSWLSAKESLRRWAVQHKCTMVNGEPVIASAWPSATAASRCIAYKGCKTDLVQCTIHDDHWLYDNANTAGLNVCEVAWDIFDGAPTPVVQ